jgi:hypothetical protein
LPTDSILAQALVITYVGSQQSEPGARTMFAVWLM